MKVHPDKNTAPGAEDAFKAVNKAFEVLSDPTRRRCVAVRRTPSLLHPQTRSHTPCHRQYDVSGEESPAPQVTRGPQFHNARDFEGVFVLSRERLCVGCTTSLSPSPSPVFLSISGASPPVLRL